MKMFKDLFLLMLCLLLVDCNDDEENFRFDGAFLKQSTWEGTSVVTNKGEIIRMSNVEMQFFTETNGQYILKSPGSSTGVYDFKYSIEGKIMNIKDGPLLGMHTLLEMSEDKMVLEELDSYKVTLTLNKKY